MYDWKSISFDKVGNISNPSMEEGSCIFLNSLTGLKVFHNQINEKSFCAFMQNNILDAQLGEK